MERRSCWPRGRIQTWRSGGGLLAGSGDDRSGTSGNCNIVRRLQDGVRLIRKRLPQAKVALLFGRRSSASPIGPQPLPLVDKIPTRTEHSSMNLGQAWRLHVRTARRCTVCGPRKRNTQASAERVERITNSAVRGSANQWVRAAAHRGSHSGKSASPPSAGFTREA